MSNTPKRFVHWNLDGSPLGSPFSDGSSMDSMTSGSSIQFINDQLVAHGFTHAPGLCLDALSNSDSERVVKCLLGMLSQRMEDMARTEELTTKLRTLSYEHERLMSMHNVVKEKAASAQREVESYKNRLTTANRALHSSEAAHKQTSLEFQRTRTTLQTVRATYQAELKKKDKELERTMEKWTKLSDTQLKLGTVASGMRCANAGILPAAGELFGRGKGYLDVAVEQAEKASKDLREDNLKLKQMFLGAVNEMQSVLHVAKNLALENEEEPTPLTMTSLFPLSPTGAASDKWHSLLGALKESLSVLSRSTTMAPSTSSSSSTQTKVSDEDVEKLQSVIDGLRSELEQARQQSTAHTTQIQEMFDCYATDERLTADMGDASFDLITVPLRDEEKDRLDARARELKKERRQFTEATIKFGKEKAAMEAEKLKLLEERRSWQVQQMLSELPPTPETSSSAPIPAQAKVSIPSRSTEPTRSPRKSLSKSTRKSPAKQGLSLAVGKGANSKRTRVSRRSSFGLSPSKHFPAFETELLPPLPAPAFRTSLARTESQPLLLPSSFVLPPPSPSSVLPPPVLLPPPTQSVLTFDSLKPSSLPSTSTLPSEPAHQPPPSTSASAVPPPCTPMARKLFPMAKPFANCMTHAYSPAKPSPLSRILMLADSPTSPGSPPLEALIEEAEEPDVSPAPAGPPIPALSLAQELGVEDSPPLREKQAMQNAVRVEPQRLTAQAKGKTKADSASGRGRVTAAVDKENNSKRGKGRPAATSVLPNSTKGSAAAAVKVAKPVFKPLVPPGPKLNPKLPASKGGPRRVPIDSAEAAPTGPGWKG